MKKDYRLKENRLEYFSALYKMNLEHGVMPGLVYLYMPELAKRYGWGDEQKLLFAFYNGMTQNPITSLRFMEQLPELPPAGAALSKFSDWFNTNWENLQFDTDRRYQKKETVTAIKAYAQLVSEHGGYQALMLTKSFKDLWAMVSTSYHSFGRLSAFSYLEYVYIMGFGADCNQMFFDDKSGSKSHRNGMFFLLGMDDKVWDKRCDKFGMVSHTGCYENFAAMCSWLERQADEYLLNSAPADGHTGRFTFESSLCTFKNHFFGRRYPGVYADLALERIEYAEARGINVDVFKDMRTSLPKWLRLECSKERKTVAENAALFAETGFPFRGEHFLENQK